MTTTMSTPMYVKTLRGGHRGRPEVDVILMALFFHIDVRVHYISETGLAKQDFGFSSEKQPCRRRVTLYLAADGAFDTVYAKSYVKSAGVVQSLLLDVILEPS